MWKAVYATLGGIVVGPLVGYSAAYCLGLISYAGSNCMYKLIATTMGWFFGVPIGAVVFCFLGFLLGAARDRRAKASVAASDEELDVPAERGGIVKVRVELTSYVNHDAIRGDLERVGFSEIDERMLLEKVFSSGSVKSVTGTISAARIEELAALSFVKAVEGRAESRH
jgi:hypothetical protein